MGKGRVEGGLLAKGDGPLPKGCQKSSLLGLLVIPGPGMSGCSGCGQKKKKNKNKPLLPPKNPDIYSAAVLEAISRKSRGCQDRNLSKVSRGGSFTSSSIWQLWLSLASASIFPWLPALCVCVSLFSEGHRSYWRMGTLHPSRTSS